MKYYSFSGLTMLVNGRRITEHADGDDSIAVSRNNDPFSHAVDQSGNMIVVRNADRTGSIVFNLDQTSTDNEYLSGLVQAAEVGVFVPVNVQMTDDNGNDMVVGAAGYITRPADMTRGTNTNSQQWTIQVENLVMSHGGSENLSISS